MKKVSLDIETDDINATVIHCICGKDVDTGETYEWYGSSISEFPDWSRQVDLFIMHNGVSFDAPVLNRLTGSNIKLSQIRDTLILSQIADPMLEGGHSLKAWGRRLGDYKLDFKDFSKLSEEMIEYCHKDVTVTVQLFNKLKEVILSEEWQDSLRCEHDIQILCEQMKDNGFYFNKQKAEDILDEVHQRMAYLENTFQEDFPPKLEEVNRIKYRRKADGSLFSSVTKAQEKYFATALDKSVTPNELVCYEYIPFNPASPKQRIERLWEAGWEPIEKTKGHIEYEREEARSWG